MRAAARPATAQAVVSFWPWIEKPADLPSVALGFAEEDVGEAEDLLEELGFSVALGFSVVLALPALEEVEGLSPPEELTAIEPLVTICLTGRLVGKTYPCR